MVTWNEYMAGVLQKILDSHSVLLHLEDKPGDLAIIEKELLKINGFFNVIIHKLDSGNYPSSNLNEIKLKLKEYLDSYYFEKEIETMAPLYSEDANRIRNIRLKILESFYDKKLITRIESILEEL